MGEREEPFVAQGLGGAMALIIDARERKLIKQFAADQISVETLDVGDILCKYSDGSGWIAERKTAGNLLFLYITHSHTP